MTDMILPEGWVEARLGDIFFIKNGYAFKSSDFVLRQKDSYPVIRISDMRDGVVNDTNSTHILLKNISDIFLINNGDLLIAMSGATTGKIGVYQNNNPAYLNQRVGNVKPYSTKYSCNKFRNLLFMLLKEDILKIAYGGAQPNISSSRIESLFIKLPPLAEQEEIAQRVDRAIGHVDELKSRLETLLTTLKTFRQSVLNAAVTGKLTEDWRRDNIIDLGRDTPLREIILVNPPKKILNDEIEVGFVPMASANESMRYDFHFEKRLWKDVKKGFTFFEDNDVLLAKITPCFENGKSVFVAGLPNKVGAGSTEFFVIRSNKQYINPHYLLYNFSTDAFLRQGALNMTGSVGHRRVPKDFLLNWVIYYPPLVEQQEIVKRVEAYFTLADQIEKQVQSALDKVNLLTQSILAKAFRGELTKEWRQKNPELISGENSAEALLKRIKAEKDALEKSSKKTPRSKVKIL